MTRNVPEGSRCCAKVIRLGGGGTGMAFRHCESCEGLIASRATVCPHCDLPLTDTELLMETPNRVSGSSSWITLLFVLIAVVMLADVTEFMN